ncbi:CcdC family protein [Metabacillus iocasae]|uniref:Membrane protein CcdC involved in cytochrome C biogenesis n=1 Tax=Priestia iocasae TaxID=2291674 RepID=A0ABS2QRE8_9BACI|nr:cytochrome c biogenesis protein CcdC [Metabacillus iocasae]MBM7701975.1 membrane protein CcdC involved in cytochrome C biogenesis [Metabacillus iocasae]
MAIASTIMAIFMASLMLFIRMKAAKKPVNAKKIILPPIFMSTGALMFIHPLFRLTAAEFLEALLVGMIFSLFLIKTSKFEVRENDIYLKRSKAFVFILIGLLVIRIVAKLYLSATIDVGQLGGMFWVLAFGMIVPWRVSMYYSYRKLERDIHSKPVDQLI